MIAGWILSDDRLMDQSDDRLMDLEVMRIPKLESDEKLIEVTVYRSDVSYRNS